MEDHATLTSLEHTMQREQVIRQSGRQVKIMKYKHLNFNYVVTVEFRDGTTRTKIFDEPHKAQIYHARKNSEFGNKIKQVKTRKI
jgi:hypothetical protein